MRTKVGIFFGGASRKRQISLAGGRNAFLVLDRALFEPVPIWVSEQGSLHALDPANFGFDPANFEHPDYLPQNPGAALDASTLSEAIDLALLTLPDSAPRGILRQAGVPYAGSEGIDENQAAGLHPHLQDPEEGSETSKITASFQCLVVRRDDQAAVAMPPMQADGSMLEGDYLLLARRRCERVFDELPQATIAVVEGSLNAEGEILIQNIDLSPSFSPEGPIFSSLSQIGLNATQTLTFLLSSCIQGAISRSPEDPDLRELLSQFSEGLRSIQTQARKKVGVLMGGAGDLRARSAKAGRHVFDLLGAMPGYLPIPLLLVSPKQGSFQVLQLPLPDLFAEELPSPTGKPGSGDSFTALEIIRDACQSITQRYGSTGQVMVPKGLNEAALARTVDVVYLQCAHSIADQGDLQLWLETGGIPYTGPNASSVRINADQTLSLKMLQHQGFPVPAFEVVRKGSFKRDAEQVLNDIESTLKYPLLASPASRRERSHARRLQNRRELEAYLLLGFGSTKDTVTEAKEILGLQSYIDFPRQDRILLSDVPAKANPAFHNLLTGLLGEWDAAGDLKYRVFPPHEISLDKEGAYIIHDQPVNPDHPQQVTQLVEQASRALDIQGLSLIELMILDDGNGQPILELAGVQTLPLLVPGHPIFRLARAEGYQPYDILESQLDFALRRPKAEAAKASAPVAKPKPRSKPLPQQVEKVSPPPVAAPTLFEKPAEPVYQTPRDENEGILDRARTLGKKTLAFLSSGFFIRNFGALLVLLLITLLLTQIVLKIYTHHGEAMQVGDYVGKNIDDVEQLAEASSFRTVVIDSVFMLDREPNVVIEQDPAAASQVKKNRRIYLTISSSTAPMVKLPGLQGAYNYDQYKRKMLRLKLKPKVLDRRFDNRLEDNTIMYLVYDGKEIKEEELNASGGIKVPVGSEVGFVVTERITEEVPAPDLVCKGYQEAAFLISSNGLVMGDVKGDVPDRRTAFVYQQEPAAGEMIEKGNRVDIFLSVSPPPECETEN